MHQTSSFYILKTAVSTDETGHVFPEIQKMSPLYNYESKDSVYELAKKTSSFPNFIPNLDYFILQNKANPTDILSNSFLTPLGFLISGKFKNVLSQCILPQHEFYEAKVSHKGIFYQYYFLHSKPIPLNMIDFQQSSFIFLKNYSQKIGTIKINSTDDLNKKKTQIKLDNPDKTITI